MIAYRDALRQDAAALAAFAAASFTDTFGRLYPQEDLAAFLAASYGREIQSEELADAEIGCRLALSDGEIAGYAMWGPVDLKIARGPKARELYRLYVRRELQGAGVAHELMRWALAQARAGGAEEMFLSVWEHNARAQSFYRRYGFEQVGEHEFMVGRTADRDLIWRAAL